MEDPNKDYHTSYRSFFESLLKSIDLDYPLPVKIANYNLTEQEISGEITTWCLQYLIDRECPPSLATILCKKVYEEIIKIEPELCGYRPQEQVYYPLQLMQETIKKLAEVCSIFLDNARLSELPPPPSSILHDPIISMCGIKNGRRSMEDRHIAIQDLHTLFSVKNAVGSASYFAVFDGHNGYDAATYANCHLHQYLVQSKHYPHNPEAALREAFVTTDKIFIEKTAKGNLESGTTAVCALIRPEESKLYLAWLGDSQSILVTRGVPYQLVKPHRPCQPEEMMRIRNMGGTVLNIGTWRVGGNLAVSRAIGDKQYKPYILSEPDIIVVPLTGKEDYLILASDGLWDYLSEQAVVGAVDSYLAENKGVAGGVSKHLVQLARKQSSRDNISCITVFLRDPSELIDNNKDYSGCSSMEVQEMEQQTSVIDQIWLRHHTAPNDAVVSGAGGRQNGRMDEDDLGPETDVDSVDDVLLSPSIAAAKAVASQETNNVATGEQVKNYVGDNEIDSGEESEEEWNYIPGKENPKDKLNQIQQIQQELNAEGDEDDDMESQLNPNAAEFVPIFIPTNIAAALDDEVSSSPAKGAEQNLENIDVPSINEFDSEISKRPSELESLSQDKSFSDVTLNGVDITALSTKAVYGEDDSINFLSSVNNSTVANSGGDDDDDEAIDVPLNDTNPFSPSHVPTETNNAQQPNTIQEQMVQDHFSLGFKPFDPLTQMLEDEGQHEDENSPDIDFMSSGKPDLLSPEVNQMAGGAAEANEGQTSSSGFDSESGPDDGDQIPTEQCNLTSAAATVGISFGGDLGLDSVNTKSMPLIDDSHPIQKIEQTISTEVITPVSHLDNVELKENDDIEIKDPQKIVESHADVLADVLTDELVCKSVSSPTDILSPVDILKDPENKGPDVEEIKLGSAAIPKQFIDLMQDLQFKQEPVGPFNKSKEDEPESDSGFEIINASEASNEPDLIESDNFNKTKQNEEEISLVNGLESVPDLLLQPKESELNRQPSPVGVGTENLIADIEGAMLESSPVMVQNTINDHVTDVLNQMEEEVVERFKLEKSSVFGENKIITEFELRKSPLPENKLLSEELIKSEEFKVDVEEILKEPTNLLLEEQNVFVVNEVEQEMVASPFVDEMKKEVMKSTIMEEVKENILELLENVEDSQIVEKLNLENRFVFDNQDIITEPTLVEIVKEIPKVAEVEKEVIPIKEDIVEKVQEQFEIMMEIKEPLEVKDVMKEQLPSTTEEDNVVFDEKIKSSTGDEEVVPTQPTPPTTPAPGVKEEDNKQELIAAAIAAAGVAVGIGAVKAVSSVESPKAEVKATVSPSKKPTGTSATSVKKSEASKTPLKSSPVTSKSPSKPAPITKKTTTVGLSAAKPAAKPASTVKAPASSKPSTPTTKVAPSSRPSPAKPSTPTTKTPATNVLTKTPPKPRTPVGAKPATSSLTSASSVKAPIGSAVNKTTKPTTQSTTSRPLSAVAAKKPELTGAKKPAASATSIKQSTLASKPATQIKTSVSAPKPTAAKLSSTTSTTKTATKPVASTVTKTTTTTTFSMKAPTKVVGSTTTRTTTVTKTATTKTATTKPTSANSTTAKAPITKTKPAAPTTVKKPTTADKTSKEATNNKLSAAKQPGPIKKPEMKLKQSETKVLEQLNQEPTVTTTNGHIENGISNEDSSPVESAPFPQIVQALN